jgi:hypothetical protein
MTAGSDRSERFQFYGWLLFVTCSIFFMADSAIAGNPLGIAGSVIFFLGCIVFLIPLVQTKA